MPSTAEAIDRYHSLLSAGYLDSTRNLLVEGTPKNKLTVAGRPTCNVLRPFFLHEPEYAAVCAAAAGVMEAFSALRERILRDSELRKILELSGPEEEIIRYDTGYGAPDVSARLDGFYHGGSLFFIEYNADSPGGVAYGDALADLFLTMPVMKEFSRYYNIRKIPVRERTFEAMRKAFQSWSGNSRELKNVAITDWSGTSTFNEFLLMKEIFESHQLAVKIVTPDEFEYREGRLYAGGDFPVDVLYKRVLVGELLNRHGIDHPIFQAVRDKNVCMFNGAQVQMLFQKILFALMSDPKYSDVFEPHSLRFIQQHIPWTRKVEERKTTHNDKTIDLIPFLQDHQTNLVLKPTSEYGGRGVVLGWEVDSESWNSAIKEALSTPTVVQERVTVDSEIFPTLSDSSVVFEPRFFDLDPYVWNGDKVEGCGIRLSKLALMNVAAGGSAAPLLVIHQRD